MTWIPVKERMPNESGEYVVFNGEWDCLDTATVDHDSDCNVFYFDHPRAEHITHWMKVDHPESD